MPTRSWARRATWPPNKHRGEAYNVGPAADQYSLGAILYELLTGRPPFQGASTLDTLDMVRNKEPVPPSLLQPKIHPDVETICLKCLEKEPGAATRMSSRWPRICVDTRRESRSWRRPISGPERLWRWCLRNRKVAALGAAVGLLLALVAAVSTTAAVMVSGRNTALHESNSARVRPGPKPRNDGTRPTASGCSPRRSARAATDQNRRLVEAELEMIGLLEANLRHVAALQGVREKVLDRAVKNLDVAAQTMTNLRNDLGWDPTAEERNWRLLARARQRLGEFYLAQSRFKEAMEQFRQMDAIIELLATAAPGDLAAQIRLGRTQRQLGFIALMKLGDTEAAQRFFRRAIAIDRECLAKQPANDTYKRDLANSLGQLAASELLLGHLEQARTLYDDETAVRDSFSSAQAADWESRRERAGLYEKLAELKLRMGDAAEARRDYSLCEEMREQLFEEHRDSWPDIDDLARTYNNLGKMRLTQDGNPAAASDLHRKALELYEKRAKADPADLDTQGRVAETLYFLATCQLRLGDVLSADSNYQRCLEIRKTLAKDPAVKGMEVNLMLAFAPLRPACRRRQDRRGTGRDATQGCPPLLSVRLRLRPRRREGWRRRPGPTVHRRRPRLPSQGEGPWVGRYRKPRNRPRCRTDPQGSGLPGTARRVPENGGTQTQLSIAQTESDEARGQQGRRHGIDRHCVADHPGLFRRGAPGSHFIAPNGQISGMRMMAAIHIRRLRGRPTLTKSVNR